MLITIYKGYDNEGVWREWSANKWADHFGKTHKFAMTHIQRAQDQGLKGTHIIEYLKIAIEMSGDPFLKEPKLTTHLDPHARGAEDTELRKWWKNRKIIEDFIFRPSGQEWRVL